MFWWTLRGSIPLLPLETSIEAKPSLVFMRFLLHLTGGLGAFCCCLLCFHFLLMDLSSMELVMCFEGEVDCGTERLSLAADCCKEG